jgi:hypothetical protein
MSVCILPTFFVSLSIAIANPSALRLAVKPTSINATNAIAMNHYRLVTKWAQSDPTAPAKLDEWLSEPDEENEDVPSGTLSKNRKWLMEVGLPYFNGSSLCEYFKHRNIDAFRRQLGQNERLDRKIIEEVVKRPSNNSPLVIIEKIFNDRIREATAADPSVINAMLS